MVKYDKSCQKVTIIKKGDGEEYTVPLDQFSDEDKIYIRQFNSDLSTSTVGQNVDPEIEFKVLLIIKKVSDTYHPLFLPIRSSMTDAEVVNARRCFEVETPRMVQKCNGGKVRFVPTVYVSEKPLRLFSASRLDSAEFYEPELLKEFYSIAKPGEYDSVGCYFLHYDTASGYTIPRAGYGVGYYQSTCAMGLFAVNCTPHINPMDQIFLHEWMHGLDGFYGNKSGVVLPLGALHGGEEHGYRDEPLHEGGTFSGWMKWYHDYLNGQIIEGNHLVGLGSVAWKHGPMGHEGLKVGDNYKIAPLQTGSYPAWIYELMKGDLSNAVLGPNLIKERLEKGAISNTSWKLNTWNPSGGARAKISVENDSPIFMIDNPTPNDSSLNRLIDLEPSRNYIFSAEIRTKNVTITEEGGRFAANLHVDGSGFTKPLSGTEQWTRVMLPFTTGPKAQSYRLRMNVGGNCSVASGQAFFRDVQLREIGFPQIK